MPSSTTLPSLRFDGKPVSLESISAVRSRIDELIERGSIDVARSGASQGRRGRAVPPKRLALSAQERRYLRERLPMLTPRELDVLVALCEGGSNEQIAGALSIALPTLRSHIARASQKLGAAGRIDLLRIGVTALLEGHRLGRIRRAEV